MVRRTRVKFTATTMVKRPTKVEFTTASGEEVEFKAKKPIKARKRVNFLAEPTKSR